MMDLERFQTLLDQPERSKAQLVTMRDHALQRNALEHVHAAEATLERRFPEWREVRSRRGGPKATDAEFMGRREHFDREKDAYVWLVERFIRHYPKPFVELDWETVFVTKGRRARYFAKSLKQLFGDQGLHMAEDSNKWCRLSNGWYAKLVLNEPQKVSLLIKFATVAGLRFGTDWDWNGSGRLNPHKSSDELLRELEEGL